MIYFAGLSPDNIVAGTDTCLSREVSDCEPGISKSFRINEKDRSTSRGGGVFIAVRSDSASSFIYVHGPLEILSVTVELTFKSCVIAVYYRPPDASSDLVENLNASLKRVQTKFTNFSIILTRDFNNPGLWCGR